MRLTTRFAIVLAIVLIVSSFGLPVLFNGPWPHPPGPVFDRNVSRLYLREIKDQQPALVFLGDSVLTKDVGTPEFQARSGLPVYKLDIPGSSSALWYLVLKTNILPARPAPRVLVILFRDTMLTAPDFRVNRPYFGLVDKFAGPKDDLLIERAYLSQLSPSRIALEKYLPLYTYRSELRESVDSGVRHFAPALLDCDRGCADDAVQYTLDDIEPEQLAVSIIRAEQVLYTPNQLDFAARVDRSFLPEMIRLAQQGGLQLIFVRAPTRIFPDPVAEPEQLGPYLKDLETYLAERDLPLVDLAWAEGIQDDHFLDPHHMTVEGKRVFTVILADALEGLIH